MNHLSIPQIHKPNNDVIRILEDILEMARTGEIQSIAMFATKSNADYLIKYAVYKGQIKLELVGGIAMLQKAVMDNE